MPHRMISPIKNKNKNVMAWVGKDLKEHQAATPLLQTGPQPPDITLDPI